jgi:hypothetical protein
MAPPRTAQAAPPVAARGDVRILGGAWPSDEPLSGAVITINGDVAVLRHATGRGERRAQVDRLTDVTVTRDPNRDIRYSGISAHLVEEVGVDPSEARLDWLLTPKGCELC